MDNGPLGVIPRSHMGGADAVAVRHARQLDRLPRDEDVAKLDVSKAVYLTGPAGSLTIHNCRTLHSSPRNMSDTGRPLLLNTLTSADAIPYTVNPIQPNTIRRSSAASERRGRITIRVRASFRPTGREATRRSSRCSRKRRSSDRRDDASA